ncbi:MAG: hypothetical protein K2X35_04330 [Bryobacteraceae bacterium]|nr:hypothetical protein [Bryobacteraceae bacterium]
MSISISSAVAFVFFLGIGYIISTYFNFQGQQWYFFMGLMAALGISVSAIFYYLMQKFQEKRDARKAAEAAATGVPVDTPAGEAEHLIREANQRLAESKTTPGAALSALPVIFLIGDRGTSKTSSVLASGVEPELLAGQVYGEGSQIAPTKVANIWFARGMGIVEAGGQVLGDPANWKALLKKLQPGQLKSIMGSGGQSPRGVVLCFDIENFTKPDAAEAIGKASRYLQERLGEVSQQLGISFPVYVLFTRCDRLPFFTEYVKTLNMEEAGQVFGVTLPMRKETGGVYGEEEARRLSDAFNNIIYSLCDKRLFFLPRETEADKIPGAYEFPREFRKLRQSLVSFLVEVGRPSQLRASPFLRGFYFSGVRPVVISDQAPVAAAEQQKSQSLQEAGGATRMFRVGMEQEQRAKAMASGAMAGGGRKVPQWLFLGHFFADILFSDRAAMSASGSSVKVSLWQRVLLGVLSLFAVLYSGLLGLSYYNNNKLERTAIDAAQAMPKTQLDAKAIPSEDDLRRLETLRQSLAEISGYEKNGAPMKMRFGLYSGSDMYPEVRRIYYEKFRQALFGNTQAGLLAFLGNVPAAPGPADDFGYGYDTLKSYLLTTSEYKRTSDASLAQFLGGRLLDRWSQGREEQIGKARLDLAKLQFDFYASDLANGNPYSDQSDAPGVERARNYLWGFGGVQTFYRALLSEAAKKGPRVTYNSKFPGTADVVVSTHPVEYAYTKDGYAFLKDLIKKKDLTGEQWVMGPPRGAAPDRAALEKGVWELYTKDYILTWRQVLQKSSVKRYENLQDAAKKLSMLTSAEAQAPLLCLMWWSSTNTAIDLPGVQPAFAVVQKVVPPQQQMACIVSENTPYNNSLMALQSGVDQASQQTPPDPNVAAATLQQATTARQAKQMLGNTFPIDQEAHLERTVGDLLEQPITYAEALLKGLGAGQLNAAGAGFCNAFSPLLRKFPFSADAKEEVTLDELGSILRPKDARLWKFYEEALKKHLNCGPEGCQTTNADPLIKMQPNFVAFFSQMMRFSRALYNEQGQGPNFRYAMSPRAAENLETFEVRVNGEAASLKGGQSKAYVWPGPGSPSFKLILKPVGGGSLEPQTFDGPWSVFRFFAEADRSLGPNTFEWISRSGRQVTMVAGKPLIYVFTIDAGGAPVVFSKEFLSTLKCVPNVAR